MKPHPRRPRSGGQEEIEYLLALEQAWTWISSDPELFQEIGASFSDAFGEELTFESFSRHAGDRSLHRVLPNYIRPIARTIH